MYLDLFNDAYAGSFDVHSRSATSTELFKPPRNLFSGVSTCLPMHGAAGTDTGSARHKAAGTDAENSGDDGSARGDDTDSEDDESDVIDGLVLFMPGPPPPGLKS